jgi:hypothetical protein
VFVSLGVKAQPVAIAHVSLVHGLLSLQVIAAPMHMPTEQVSGPVHAFASLHGAPLAGWCTQPTIMAQLSSVQGSASSQTGSVGGVQVT